MSLAEIEAGQRRVRQLLGELDKDARGTFLAPTATEIYPFEVRLGAKSALLQFHAEELEELAHNGQVKAGIMVRLKGALDSLKRDP